MHFPLKYNLALGDITGQIRDGVRYIVIGHAPYYSPLGTSFWIDGSLSDFKEALQLMGRLAELKISIMRLANEVRKTIRKVNALEKIAIPELAESVAYIQNRLEENERDMFVLMKMIKTRLEKKKEP
ncbi:V-type ATP synthase subunit D [subsurface metagenome]